MSKPEELENNLLAEDKEEKEEEVVDPSTLALRAAPTSVEVHPLVLLSVVDHFARMNSKVQQNRRVVGLLLGSYMKPRESDGKAATLDINNCFAVPFDEDPKDPSVWFFDTNFAEEMFKMYKKVLPKVKVVGWYTSGSEISKNDIHVHLLVAQRFCPNPVCCIVNTDPANKGVPILAYTTQGSLDSTDVVFRNILCNLASLEAEEIGIEHLLRDITDTTVTSLSSKVNDRQLALSKLDLYLGIVEDYLNDVAAGKLAVSHAIMGQIQELMDLLPLVHQMKTDPAMVVATNDDQLATLVASVGRTVMSLYDVILNRRKMAAQIVENKEKAKKAEEEKAKKEEEEKKKKADAEEKKKEVADAEKKN